MSLRLETMSSAPTEGLFGAAVAISAGAAFLLLPALINGFPFVFPDSEDYLVFKPFPFCQPYFGLFLFVFLPVYSGPFTLFWPANFRWLHNGRLLYPCDVARLVHFVPPLARSYED